MFRLIKLATYALLGYALYEFFRGMSDTEARPRPRFAPGQSQGQRQGEMSGQRMTGGGEGTETETQGSDGGSTRHVVGRGVVTR